MEWNRSNSNGAVAPPHSQQYLLPSASSMVTSAQSQLSSVQQNTFVQSRSFNANKDPILQNLLKAQTNEDYFHVQQAALNCRSIRPKPHNNQVKSNPQISSYKPAKEGVSIPDNRSAIPAQNSVGSNYRMPTYVNTVHQTTQQPPPVAVGQQFGGNVYTTTVQQPLQNSQQPLQNSQALQTYQPTVTYSYAQQNNLYNAIRPPANAIQMSCQQMAPNVLPSAMYSSQNGVSGQFVSPQKSRTETNISARMQDCRNGQNISSPSLSNYRSLAPNMLQTLSHLDGNANCYTQRQNFQNVFNNSPQTTSAAAEMPPSYTEATTNLPNVSSASVNQNFSKQRQNYVVANVQQQPAQTGNPQPVQSSVGDEQSRIRDIIASQERKHEMLKMLLVYRSVRKKYELLNQENNLLRQRLQSSTSQENTGPPPLLSSLPVAQPQANCIMAGQQNVTQAVPVQNSAQINSAKGFHSQNMYDHVMNTPNQAGIQHNLSMQENTVVLNQMLRSDNGNLHRQNNYSVFDGGQANVSNSTLQSLCSENATTKGSQKATSREFGGQANFNNQYASSSNSNNENVLKNGLGLHSPDKPASVSQRLNPACQENNSYGHLSYTTGLTANGQVVSVSREAIEASLPLWKAVPQSTNRSSETQHNRSPVDRSLAAFRLLDEMTLGPTNEVSSTISLQKQDSTVQNPQIAIVSPLVQSKEAFREDYQMSKVCIEGPDVENPAINSLMDTRKSDCFNDILQEIESLGASTLNNIDTSRSKDSPVDRQDHLASPLPFGTEATSPHTQPKTSSDIEIVDDSLQISGICTLVEGNSLYDSSIAMIFDETSDTTALLHTNTRDDHSKTIDTSHILKEPSNTSPKAVTVSIKSEPVDDVVVDGQTTEGDKQCSEIPCVDMEADQQLGSAQQKSCYDLESSAVSDQLSELLTEFPYGIKNYMSENILECVNGAPPRRPTDKPELEAASENFEAECKTVGHIQSEMVPVPSVNLQHVVKMDSELSTDFRLPAEKTDFGPPAAEVQKTEMVPILTKDVGGNSIPVDACLDDGFEILSNSPVSDIHITILDQDEIPKIFPSENECVDTKKCNEVKLEVLQECSNTHEPGNKSDSLKDSTDLIEAGTDKNLFCCLFSWLNLTNKNAPKCNCKQLEASKEADSTKLSSNDSILKSDLSPQTPEPTLQGLPKPSNSGFEILQTDRPPKLDLVDSENEEILQPMEKPPKLERIVSEAAHVPKISPQAKKCLKRSTSVEAFQSSKDSLMKNIPVNHEKNVTPSLKDGKTTSRNQNQSPNKLKSHGSRKSEKLIVKTDFLKSKHSYKEKGEPEGKKAVTIAQLVLNKSDSHSGSSKDSPGESGKQSRGEEKLGQSTSTVRVEKSDQQADRSLNRPKYSPGVDRNGRSRGGRKRKERESHFETTRKVPTVQEYLERKRELCKKRTEARIEPREHLGDVRHTAERPSEISGNPCNLKRPLSPAKTVTSKENNRYSEMSKVYQKDRSQSGGTYEAGHRRRKDLHNSQRVPANKALNAGRSSSNDKIYLTPVNSRRSSYEGINLAKLQIRHSPEKPKYTERRKSLENSCLSKPSNSAVKNRDSPEMLKFKLCPEFGYGSPTTQESAGETTDPKAKSVVEGIKSSKEAWCNNIPLKKRKVEGVEAHGFQKSPVSAESTPLYKPLERNNTRTPQGSQTTFSVFKQIYQKRSKSLDFSQGNT
ncbi:retroelement silencing factor 1 isoform X2 [Lithobates pipiens]